jgi:hypothetical protein
MSEAKQNFRERELAKNHSRVKNKQGREKKGEKERRETEGKKENL